MHTKNLDIVYEQIDVFYKNIKELVKINKEKTNKMFGHSIYRKSDDALFNAIESSSICIGSLITCLCLKESNLLAFDPFITATISSFVIAPLAFILNNVIYHINLKIGGPIGRTYAKMRSDDYIKRLEELLEKDYNSVLRNDESNIKKLNAFVEFAEKLDNVANNLGNHYEKLCNRVKKYSPEEQKKWEPILNEILEYSTFLSNNAEKFNTYVEKLDNYPEMYPISDFEKLSVTKNKKHSSVFIEFKNYLKNKKHKELIETVTSEDETEEDGLTL